MEYQVWGDEGRGQVNVLLQLRQKNNRGKTVQLDPPGSVKLDGEVLRPDSSRMTGIFYEAHLPLAEFAGRHKIIVTGENGEQVVEEFEYTPFTLITPLEGRVGRQNLVLELSGLTNGDRVRVTMVDMEFSTQDINELVSVVNGRLPITPEQLKDVQGGPVTLLLFKEEERVLQNPAVRGGRMAVTYGLMREFELADE